MDLLTINTKSLYRLRAVLQYSKVITKLEQGATNVVETKMIPYITLPLLILIMISNGNRTEWSPGWSVIMRAVTKSDDRAADSYDYRPH